MICWMNSCAFSLTIPSSVSHIGLLDAPWGPAISSLFTHPLILALAGVTVRLQLSGLLSEGGVRTTVTVASGAYSFFPVGEGNHTIEILNNSPDMSFGPGQAAPISTDGQVLTINFVGSYDPTSSIVGSVTGTPAEPLSGVTVSLSGDPSRSTTTDANGQYAFAWIFPRFCTVSISGFDATKYTFPNTSQSVIVGPGASEAVDFSGIPVSPSMITGTVSVGLPAEPLSGVTVSLSGDPSRSTTTDANGQYAFAWIIPGSHTVSISGFDAAQYTFPTTSQSVTVGVGASGVVNFSGTPVSTSISFLVLLVNSSGLATHILQPGENFAMSNQLRPGAVRTVTFVGENGDMFTFWAGRNQQVLATQSCRADNIDPTDPAAFVPVVTYTESPGPTLTCSNC